MVRPGAARTHLATLIRFPRSLLLSIAVCMCRKTCFEDVDIMMFVVNLAGYSQRLFEDETEIRMHEALRLFEKVVGNPAFKQSHIVVRF